MFTLDDLVISSTGTIVRVMGFYPEEPDTFHGARVDGKYDVSGLWLKSEFKKYVHTKYNKSYRSYYKTCGVYKFLKKKIITKEQAIELLNKRAGTNKKLARATVELWMNYPKKEFHHGSESVTNCHQLNGGESS